MCHFWAVLIGIVSGGPKGGVRGALPADLESCGSYLEYMPSSAVGVFRQEHRAHAGMLCLGAEYNQRTLLSFLWLDLEATRHAQKQDRENEFPLQGPRQLQPCMQPMAWRTVVSTRLWNVWSTDGELFSVSMNWILCSQASVKSLKAHNLGSLCHRGYSYLW